MQLYQNLKVRNDGFLVKNDGTVVVYTDGACRNNNRKNGRHSGSGIFWGDYRKSYSIPFPKDDDALNTNQYAEVRAILYAARYAKRAGIDRLEIRTDSKFCIDSLTKFIDNWIRNADKDGIWRSQKGTPVVHQKIFREINNISKRINISYQYVPGHSGERGNDAADRLAEVAADRATYFFNRKKLQAKSAASSGHQKSSKLTADDLINNNNVARIGYISASPAY